MNYLFNQEERLELISTYRRLLRSMGDTILPDDIKKVKHYTGRVAADDNNEKDTYGMNRLLQAMRTALIVGDEIGLKRSSVLAVLLSYLVMQEHCTLADIEKDFGSDTANIIRGLIKTHELYGKNAAIDNEHFRTLLISFAANIGKKLKIHYLCEYLGCIYKLNEGFI